MFCLDVDALLIPRHLFEVADVAYDSTHYHDMQFHWYRMGRGRRKKTVV